MSRLLTVSASLLLIFIAVPATGADDAPGQPAATQTREPIILQVQLLQGTAGAPLPPKGRSVQLIMMSRTAPLRSTFAAESDSDGLARIEIDRSIVEREGPVRAIALTMHNDVRFYSQPLLLTSDAAQPIQTSLTIYETTTDAGALSVARQAIAILGHHRGLLAVQEIILLRNSADRVVVDSEGNLPPLTDQLPEGAIFDPQNTTSNVHVTDAGDAGDANRILLHGPFLPHDTQIVVSYMLPLKNWPARLRKPLPGVMPQRFEVAVATRTFDISADGRLGEQYIERDLLPGLPLLVRPIKIDNLRPGNEITIQINRLATSELPQWSYIVTVAVAVLLLGLVLFRRSDRNLQDDKP